MEEQRGISSGVVSEPASNSVISGEKRNGNGLDEKDELGSKRVKVPDLASGNSRVFFYLEWSNSIVRNDLYH
jgi:hypothetical protein